jgi:aminomethyltransferase
MKRPALADVHRSMGARMVAFAGWELPLSYPGGSLAEHLACRSSAAVFDVSHLETLEVAGDGAAERLQRRLSNDVDRLGVGHAHYTLLLDTHGSVQDDLVLWRLGAKCFWVQANAANAELVASELGALSLSASRVLLALQGPTSRLVLRAAEMPGADVDVNEVAALQWEGAEVVVAGTGYTGEDGVELSVPVALGRRAWERLVDAGARPAGLGARDSLRLEAGLPLHGVDLVPGVSALEARLGWAIAFDMGTDFPGRSALEEQRRAGVRRRLLGVRSSLRRPLRPGDEVADDASGARIGEVTSGGYSPVLEVGIGLALLDASVGDGAGVVVRRGTLPLGDAQVVRPPFVQGSRRKKGRSNLG